jgi:wyosine [tRNA(Phe)-imidazoG37] synthetase (radical SAM superfamily)
MNSMNKINIFGPVPSRRLGQSLGINNIIPKNCTYSCIYCQIGTTNKKICERKSFYEPSKIKDAVKAKISELINKGLSVDYLSFVPDGEPTLDINLGEVIKKLKNLGIKIAVISNSSLLWRKDVQDDISNADYVSLKIDTVNEKSWNMINKPHASLKINKILSGIEIFSKKYNGILCTETMLIKNINDTVFEFEKLADFILNIKSYKSYISIPIRPPAEKYVKPAEEVDINTAYQIFKDRSIVTELLTDYEENKFVCEGDFIDNLLKITSVHPIREENLKDLLIKNNKSWDVIIKLLREKKLIETEYNRNKFYIRNFSF